MPFCPPHPLQQPQPLTPAEMEMQENLKKSLGERGFFIKDQHLFEKAITDVDGIDQNVGAALRAQGYVFARQLLGECLFRLQEQEISFQEWLRGFNFGDDYQLHLCESCLSEWATKHLGVPGRS